MREKRETCHHGFSNMGAKLEIRRIDAFPVLLYQLSCAITPFWNRLTRYGVGALDQVPAPHRRTVMLALPTFPLESKARSEMECSPGPVTGRSSK